MKNLSEVRENQEGMPILVKVLYQKKNNDLILEPLKCCNIGFLLEVRPDICGHHIRSICCTKFSASSSTFPPRKYV